MRRTSPTQAFDARHPWERSAHAYPVEKGRRRMNTGLLKDSDRLPAIIDRIGGSLAEVARWEQHRNLPARTQYAVGQILRVYPELNHEEPVDFMLDLASHFGIDIERQMAELLGTYSPQVVHMAAEWMWESGLWRQGEAHLTPLGSVLQSSMASARSAGLM